MERLYVLEEADVQEFIGVNRANLVTLQSLFPKTKLRIHQNVIKVLGEDQAAEELLHILSSLEQICSRYNQLTEAQIIDTVRRHRSKKTSEEAPASTESDVLIYGVHGKAILPRGERQRRMVREFASRDLCFATGAAGSGKTFLAICLAVKALKSKQVRRIILSRPAVEAGEKLGFLPGEMKDKLDPYLQPLYDALGELIPAPKLKDLIDTGVIQIAPLAFMRGRTLSDAIIILDEATANVDPENEKDLMEAVQALTKEKTILMIAHRLKTVKNADQIFVVDKGQIVQSGTHDELMKQDGIYRRFVDSRRQAIGWKIG